MSLAADVARNHCLVLICKSSARNKDNKWLIAGTVLYIKFCILPYWNPKQRQHRGERSRSHAKPAHAREVAAINLQVSAHSPQQQGMSMPERHVDDPIASRLPGSYTLFESNVAAASILMHTDDHAHRSIPVQQSYA